MSTEQEYRITSILERLERLRGLQVNWDSYQGLPIHPGAIEAVRRFVGTVGETLPNLRSLVVPLSYGGVQLEWHRGEKILELEFDAEGTITYLQWHPEADIGKEGIISTDGVGELFQWLEE